MPASRFITAMEQSLQTYPLAAGAIVAVSGGADSVALLRGLLEIHGSSVPMVIAHLNHCLRGAESDGDEQFIRSLHASLCHSGYTHLHLRCERIDIQKQATSAHANLEATARKARYAWLTQVAEEEQIPAVATGHTADDQAETVLHRLLRGTGIQGLCGIAHSRPLTPVVDLIRPMLFATRADVESYLEELGQSFRHDSSNADDRFTRNRIRHELLPTMARDYNPAIREVLCRLAEQAGEAHADEQVEAEHCLAEAELPRSGSVVILSLQALQQLSRRQIRLVFRLVWNRESWPRGQMGYEQWKRLESIVHNNITAVDLPGKMRARRRRGVVQAGPITDITRL